MSAGSETRVLPTYRQIVTHLNSPLYRNGYYLISSSLATSAIGLVYWILAARQYSTYIVGLNSAVIAAMTFLAGVSELNLMSALIRFLPTSGRSTKSFVIYSYLISLLIAAVVSAIFIKNLSLWSPALQFLGANPVLAMWFIISTMGWCIFVLQDSVLTGLQQTSWVPLENTLFSLLKIAIMLIMVGITASLGIFASWSLSLLAVILPTNYFIFRKLIPAHMQQADQTNRQIDVRQVTRYVAADYMGALFLIISTTLMPVIVTTLVGATANAYFYLSWTIANSLYLIGPGMGQSLVVEASKDQHKLAQYSQKLFKNAIRMVIPAVAVVVIAAPYILMIFGKGYSDAGSTLLRLLALSAIPHTINAIFYSVSRVKRHMKAVFVTLGFLCILVLSLSFAFLKLYGIVGVGMAWLISQTVIAVFVSSTQLRKLWANKDVNMGDSKGTLPKPSLKAALIFALYKIAQRSNLFPILTHLKSEWSMRKGQEKLSNLLPKISETLPMEVLGRAQGGWTIQRVANNDTNTTVAFVNTLDGLTPLVIKLPANQKEIDSLARQSENLKSLSEDKRLGDWRNLLPITLFQGNVDGQVYFVERALPGETVYNKLESSESSLDILKLAAAEIGNLHRMTSFDTVVDMSLLESWIREPMDNLRSLSTKSSMFKINQRSIDHLETEMHSELIGQRVQVSWIHGDYSPKNILINSEGNQVTGIVDWDLARPDSLPGLDVMHLLVSMRMKDHKCEMGQVVRELLLNEDWTSDELQVIQAAGHGLPESPLSLRVMLLLCWSQHINANLSKTARFDQHSVWISENILAVLNAL